jgi:hypothetical protein
MDLNEFMLVGDFDEQQHFINSTIRPGGEFSRVFFSQASDQGRELGGS